MIEFIKQHADVIRAYQQPAIPWAYKNGNTLKACVQYAKERGALAGIEYQPMTRQDVVNYFTQDLYRGFIATMLWGHKTWGFKTVVDSDKNDVIKKLNNVKTFLIQGEIRNAFVYLYSNETSIEKVGPSFITKLLYFMSKAFAPQNTPQPLILDSHMIVVHCALLLDEYHSGHELYKWRDSSGIVWYHDTNDGVTDVYMDYITRLNNIAETIYTTSENLEAFLFSLHPANLLSFIYQEVFIQRAII